MYILQPRPSPIHNFKVIHLPQIYVDAAGKTTPPILTTHIEDTLVLLAGKTCTVQVSKTLVVIHPPTPDSIVARPMHVFTEHYYTENTEKYSYWVQTLPRKQIHKSSQTHTQSAVVRVVTLTGHSQCHTHPLPMPIYMALSHRQRTPSATQTCMSIILCSQDSLSMGHIHIHTLSIMYVWMDLQVLSILRKWPRDFFLD